MLEGMAEIAEQIFDLPVRRASPEGVGGLADHVNNPAFATSVGLVVYTHRNLQSEPARVGAGTHRPNHGPAAHVVQGILLDPGRSIAGELHVWTLANPGSHRPREAAHSAR